MTVLDEFAATARACAGGSRLALHLTDSLGAWIAGAATSEGRALAALPGEAVGAGLGGAVARAVAQARLTEIDDIHMRSCTTVGAAIVPTAMLVAAHVGADGARLGTAASAGYAAMIRLGNALDGARILYRGLWPTYLVAPFACAMASAHLLGLDDAQSAHALALALAQTSGAPGGPGGGRNPRWLLAGFAARAGVQAAFLAREGFCADRSLLDGDWFSRTHGLALDPAPLLAPADDPFAAMSLKPFCVAKQALAGVSAFQDLLADGLRADEIASVRAFVPAAYRAMIGHRPPGRLGRIVHLGWQCACAALRPHALLDLEREDFSQDPAFADLAGRVEVIADAALEADFPDRYPARIEIATHDGRMLERTIRDAPGDPARPLDGAAVRAKFLRVVGDARGAGEAASLHEAAAGLALADAAGVRALADACGAAPTAPHS